MNLSLLLSGLQSSLASLGKSSRRVATVPLRPKGRDLMDDECGKVLEDTSGESEFNTAKKEQKVGLKKVHCHQK